MVEVKRSGVAVLPREFIGLGTDTKPTGSDVPPGSTFTVVDGSGNIVDVYIYDGTTWNH